MLARGLLGILGLFILGDPHSTGLPAAWGQLVPAADSRLPGQPVPPAGEAPNRITSDRSRPLIAYRRDQPEMSVPSSQPKMSVPASPLEMGVPASPLEMGAPADHGNSRRLLPASDHSSIRKTETGEAQGAPSSDPRISRLFHSFPKMDALRTTGTGLGIALGLLLLCAWMFRRNSPSPTTPLPKDVLSILGRAPLATRQFVQLLKIGNKLVLVSVTQEGAKPITEVTDPVEVDRHLGLCMRNHAQSTTAEFQQVLNQLSREGTKGFLGK